MINVVCGIRSTGRICTDLATALESQGHEVKIAYGREEVPVQFKKYAVRIGNDLDVKLHGVKARLFDACGFGSKRATLEFIKWIPKYDPDVIHLHNLHGYYINIEVLFDYLRTCNKRIIWTLHDCWAFTGHAAFCEGVNCKKYIKGCYSCPKIGDYPKSIVDKAASNWEKKKTTFGGISNLTIVTPSDWLKRLLSDSFLKCYKVQVIKNGINTDIFKPIDDIDTINEQLGLGDKRIVLGVAAVWEDRKGLNDFILLNQLLDNEKYQIVLVGVSKKQIETLPKSILGLPKTNSVQQLVELYNLAYVFVNPTYEDNYPTTNLEAISCGTPVITYNTGGSPESAKLYGIVVEKGNIQGIVNAIEEKIDKFKDAPTVSFDSAKFVNEYVSLLSISETI